MKKGLTKEKARFAVIGSGGMGSRRAEQFLEREDCEVAVIASRNEETGRELARKCDCEFLDDWREALEMSEVDAVFVATPNHLHGENILASLEAGLPVLSEYPACRDSREAGRLEDAIRQGAVPLQFTHRELVSENHAGLRAALRERGALMQASFQRLTPGRGARPEVLFNLVKSGPPALFFVYQVYPWIDLFGAADEVDARGHYQDLNTETKAYRSFTNTVTVNFREGGSGHWMWAGGIAIDSARQEERFVLENGTLLRGPDDDWIDGATGQALDLPRDDGLEAKLLDRFIQTLRAPEHSRWREDALKALEATKVGLAAEESMKTGQRIHLA
jgi:predicted dehydrogenase